MNDHHRCDRCNTLSDNLMEVILLGGIPKLWCPSCRNPAPKEDPVEYKQLSIKEKLRYIVVKSSVDGKILAGMPLHLEKEKDGRYSLFTMCRVGNRDYLHQHNDYRRFMNQEDLSNALAGIEVILDIKWARERIDIYQEKIKELEEIYFSSKP